MRRHSPLMVTAFVFWIGTILLAVVVVTTSGIPSVHYSTRVWIAVAEQGLLATASTTLLWNWGLKRVPASQAGIFVNLEPLVGAILGVSVLHEVLGRMAVALWSSWLWRSGAVPQGALAWRSSRISKVKL